MAKYQANKTGQAFHNDLDSPIKLIMSAVGCGKTVICIQDLLTHAMRQEPDAYGVRRTRWAIVRSSYSQLKTTTIKTFQEWIPQKICPIVYDSPIRGHIKMLPLPDGTLMDAEFLFMSLDSPDALGNLLSLELTGAFINEIAEIKNSNIIKDVHQRCARFPPKKDGVGATWSGVIADFNPCARGSWLHKLLEVDRTLGYTLYRMPPPLLVMRDLEDPDDVTKIRFVDNPDAENVQNHAKGYDYWHEIAQLNINDWEYVKRFVLGDYPNGVGGKGIFTNFYSGTRHTGRVGTILPQRSSLLLCGVDFGLTPAVAIKQYVDGRIVQFDEITCRDSSVTEMIEEDLVPLLRDKYMGYKVLMIGDPTGGGRDQYAKMHPKKLFRQFGLKYVKAPTNDFATLRDCTNKFLRRKDGYVVMENCEETVSGFHGGYKWKDARGSTTTQKPQKDGEDGWYSHIMDASMQVDIYLEKGGNVYADDITDDPDSFASVYRNEVSGRPEPQFLYA